MKKLIALVVTLIVSLFTCTACGGSRVSNDPQTLEIYVWDGGYGHDWTFALAEEFAKQDWVKEKYPELKIHIDYNTFTTYAKERIQAGAKANTIDLFFDSAMMQLANSLDPSGRPWLANLDDIYYEKLPNEDITLEEKVLPSFLNTNEDGNYFATSWAAGMNGILYNVDLLEALGQEVPLTTDQFIQVCDNIKKMDGQVGGYTHTYSIMSSVSTGYWLYIFNTLWAQYEGYEQYVNFYNGIDYDNARSREIFKQQGRLEALKVIDTLVDQKNGYIYENGTELLFMEAQDRLLSGDGIFQANGDWFESEMAASKEGLKNQYGIDYEISFMKTPVISAIVNRTPSIRALAESNRSLYPTDDAALAAVVAAIDRGETSFAGVTSADFDIIVEARTVVDALGYDHQAVIPDYASGKEVAKDFLRFMATDIGIYTYIQSTNGATLPYRYSVSEKAPELYETIAPMHKVKMEIYENEQFPIQVLPSPSMFKLYYNGQIQVVSASMGLEAALFGSSSGEDLYNATIEYYTQSRWESLLNSSGL